MADARRDNRRWLALFWIAAAVLLLGPPAYVATLWFRQQSAISGLKEGGHTVRALEQVGEARLERLPVISVESLSLPRYRFEFAAETRISPTIADLLVPTPKRPLISLFPPLDVEISVADAEVDPIISNSLTNELMGQAVTHASSLHPLHSLEIASPRTGALFDRTWGIRELDVFSNEALTSVPDSWKHLNLQRLDQSMPKLHALSLSGIEWDKPVNFPEQGFNDLKTLVLGQVSTERLQLYKRRGLKYASIDGNIKELIVSDCPDLERLELSITLPDSVAVQHLPRLKGLYLQHSSSLKIDCVIADLPELEAILLHGHFRATHLQLLGDMPKLKRVCLDVWLLDDAMIDQLIKIKSLEELHLDIGRLRGNLSKLGALPNLKVLQVYSHDEKLQERPELKALATNGRIHVEVLETLDEIEVESPEEENDGDASAQPMPNAPPTAAPGTATPSTATPATAAPGKAAP